MGDLLTGPLHDRHEALGATLGPFGGWSMPISYPGGTLGEHAAVREDVGIFDVSHLGKLAVTGPGAAAFVDSCLTADLGRLGPGRAQYTLCCTETGGVIDDVIVYLVGPDDVLVVPNAANAAQVATLLAAAAPAGIEVLDRHHDLAVLAVQGPRSATAVRTLFADLPGQDYMAFSDVPSTAGVVTRVCRTGYTGEHGYELLVPWAAAGQVWDGIVAAGARPCGLGARDTLRTEMGYPLHGQDLSVDISPVQAGSGWAVGWSKPAFWGRDALLAEKAAGPARRLRGLRATGRGIPRPGMDVLHDGRRVGVTTSGTFSPTLRVGVALAMVDAASGVGIDDEVSVDVRGRALPCVVTKPPFVPSHVR